MMTERVIQSIPGDRFTWKHGIGFAEHSSLGSIPLGPDDRISVVSHRTGRSVVFRVVGQLFDDDRSLIGWQLTAVNPELSLSLIIQND